MEVLGEALMGKHLWIPLALCALLVLPAPSQGLIFDLAKTLSDPADDVTDVDGNPVQGHDDIDIVKVVLSEEGEDLNVTLRLAGEWNMTATYVVDLVVDGTDEYELVRMAAVGSKVYGPDDQQVPSRGQIGGGGTEITWWIAKDEIPAETSIELGDGAATKIVTIGAARTLRDRVEGVEPSNGEERVRHRIKHKLNIVELGIVGIEYITYLEGEESVSLRSRLDLDVDGTVDTSEVEAELNALEDLHGAELRTSDMTLDDKRADVFGYSITVNHAEGPVDSTETIELILHKSMSWDFVEPKAFHVYGLGSEAIGGDEPWENTPGSVLEINTPLNWEFDVHDFPPGVEDLVEEGRQQLTVTGDEWLEWNSTMGQVETVTIERKGDGEGGGGLVPGFMAPLALAALVAVSASSRSCWRTRWSRNDR